MPDEPDDTLSVVVNDPDEGGADERAADTRQGNPDAERWAKLQGWKPESEWKGDKSNWRPAEEFLAEQPKILDKLREDRRRDRDKLNKIVGEVAKLQSTQRQAGDAELRRQMDAAVEAGDLEAARKLLKDAQTSRAPVDADENPAFTAFKERNDWWDVDDEATAYAAVLDARYAKGGISDPEAHMRKVEAGVKKAFPKLFSEDAPEPEAKDDKKGEQPQRRAPLVANGNRTSGSNSNGALTVAGMTPAMRAAARDARVTPEAYVKSFNQLNGAGA